MTWKSSRLSLAACLALAQLFAGCENAAPEGTPEDSPQEDDSSDSPSDLAQTQQSLVDAVPRTPNPWLAFLKPGTQPDYNFWRTYMREKWKTRRTARRPRSLTSLVSVSESESNNTQGTADPVTGFGSAADPTALVNGSVATSSDVDFFSFTLQPGDVISAAVPGARTLTLRNPSGSILVQSSQDLSFTYPAESPLPGNRTDDTPRAAFAYVVNTAGTYALSIGGQTGSYQMELEVYRPKFDAGGVQTIFLDFDGATFDPAIFESPSTGPRPFSPLRDFLPQFGLTAADENALITAIVEEVRESLSADLIARGLNPRFTLDLRNSRDHADPFGDPNVSRVVVGGTEQQLGFATIGIAQSIDPGNFASGETAIVLLDTLAAILPSIPRASGVSALSLIATGVGNIVAHEAGHYLGNYHTDNRNAAANIMDQGGELENTIGLGPDGTFGTADDLDVDFGVDIYVPNEGFVGNEDTLNTIAFATSGQGALGRLTVRPALFCGGRLTVELRDANQTTAPSVTITASSGDSETLALTGTGGIFTGGIDTVNAPAAVGDGRLQVQGVAAVTATYQDTNNGSGAAATVTAQVGADCQAATISGVQTRNISDNAALVSFTTSEPTTARVDFGTSCASLTQNATSPLGTSHNVSLRPLTANTTYYYAVTAIDSVGNSARADNGGACFTFRTAASTRVLFNNFESGLGGFTVANTFGDVVRWHVTSACAAAQAGHSRPNALWFGVDASCDYFGGALFRQAGTATSPTFSVSGQAVTKLRFNYLLGTYTDYPFYDRAQVALSVNGGPWQVIHSNKQGTLPETSTWAPFEVDLYSYLGGATSANVAVRFLFDTYAGPSPEFPGFYVDDFEVVQLAAGTDCTTAAQCSDGLFCTGVEACVSGRCVRGRPPCFDGTDCTVDTCNEAEDRCLNAPDVFYCIDEDHCDGQDLCQPGAVGAGCIALGDPCAGTGLVCSATERACVPPCRSTRLDAAFEDGSLDFDVTPTVTVNADAGDRPGTVGTLGLDIDDSGSVTSLPIDATGAGPLRLQYWMDVNAFDTGENVRVQYCAANCTTASNWITLATVVGTTGWRSYDHAIPTTANTETLQVRWVSTGNGVYEWAHIDDILLRDSSCSAPLPPANPQPPVLNAVTVTINPANGNVRLTGTASDPNNDIAFVESGLLGATLAEVLYVQAAGTTNWSVQYYLPPGTYFYFVQAWDREQLSSDGREGEFTVPEPSTGPQPGLILEQNFNGGSIAPFTSQGAVTVIASAGDRPGGTAGVGAQINDAGRIVSPAIDATTRPGNLSLSYWMDVNGFDSGEYTRVSYCVANCTIESSWVQLAQAVGTTGWRSYTHALPASAKTTTLQLRWLSNANGISEWTHLDDIQLVTQ